MRLLKILLRWLYRLLGLEAVRLNLRLRARSGRFYRYASGDIMAKIGDTLVASIRPTNAAGDAAPVTDVVWSLDDAGRAAWDLVADGSSATLTAKAATLGFGGALTVAAVTKSGATLTESANPPEVDGVDEEAVALNLTIA